MPGAITRISENQSITLSNALIEIESGVVVKITGSGNTISTLGDGGSIRVTGDHNSVSIKGFGSVVEIAGDECVVRADHNLVRALDGSSATIIGEGNRVVVDGIDIKVDVVGSDYDIQATKAGNLIGLTGDRESIQANGSRIVFNAGADGFVHGENNSVTADGRDIRVEVYGSNTNVVSKVSGTILGLHGTNQQVVGSEDTIWFNENSSGSVTGARNHVLAYGAGVSIDVKGNDQVITSEGLGNSIGLWGERFQINSTDASFSFHEGADAFFNGGKNWFVSDGSEVGIGTSGSLTSVRAPAIATLHASETITGAHAAAVPAARPAYSPPVVIGTGFASFDYSTPTNYVLPGLQPADVTTFVQAATSTFPTYQSTATNLYGNYSLGTYGSYDYSSYGTPSSATNWGTAPSSVNSTPSQNYSGLSGNDIAGAILGGVGSGFSSFAESSVLPKSTYILGASTGLANHIVALPAIVGLTGSLAEGASYAASGNYEAGGRSLAGAVGGFVGGEVGGVVGGFAASTLFGAEIGSVGGVAGIAIGATFGAAVGIYMGSNAYDSALGSVSSYTNAYGSYEFSTGFDISYGSAWY